MDLNKYKQLNNFSYIFGIIKSFIIKDILLMMSYRFHFLLNLFGVFFVLFTFYFISKMFGESASPYLKPYGGNYFTFVLLGVAFSRYQETALNSFNMALRREQLLGTIESILIAPPSITLMIFCMAIWSFIYTSIIVFLYLTLGIVFFDVSIVKPDIIAIVILLFLSIVSFSSFGIISASFIILFKKGDPLTRLFSSLSVLFGGVYFPIEVLHPKIVFISKLIPMTYSLQGLRMALLKGHTLSQLTYEIKALVLFIVIVFPIAFILFKFSINKVKKNGTMIHY